MGSDRDSNGGNEPGVMPARSPARAKSKKDYQERVQDIRDSADREQAEREATSQLDKRTAAAKNRPMLEMLLDPTAKIDAVVGSAMRNTIADRIRMGGQIVKDTTGNVVGVVEKGKGIFGQDTYTGRSEFNPIGYGRNNYGVKKTKYGYITKSVETTGGGGGGGSATAPAAGEPSSPAPSPTLASSSMSGGARRRSVQAARASGATRRQFLG